MKKTILLLLGAGAVYLIWKASQKKEMPKVTPSSSLMEDMQTYSSNVGNSLIPKAILKDYNSDSTATVSKNRNRLNLIVV